MMFFGLFKKRENNGIFSIKRTWGGLIMSGNVKLPHTCPKCGVVAKTAKELQEKFGFRTTSDKTATNQSWCKNCR